MRLRVPDEGATVVHDVDSRRHALRARAPRRPRDRARGRLRALQLRGRDRRPRRRHHARRPRRGPPLEHAQAAARAGGRAKPRASAHRRRCRCTRTCRCCTGPTARSSPSATAPPPCRSCATPATCRRRSATTWRCSAGGRATTRRCCPRRSSWSASRWSASSRNPARFDETKLRWLNGLYMRGLAPAELARRLEGLLGPRGTGRGRADQPGEDPDAGGLLATCGPAAGRADRRCESPRALAGRARSGDARAHARGARRARKLR